MVGCLVGLVWLSALSPFHLFYYSQDLKIKIKVLKKRILTESELSAKLECK